MDYRDTLGLGTPNEYLYRFEINTDAIDKAQKEFQEYFKGVAECLLFRENLSEHSMRDLLLGGDE